jgi:predicted phosphodiesterase
VRFLIISDIHANIQAFHRVLNQAQHHFDSILCLGDIVGQGPNPDDCVELLIDCFDHYPGAVVIGNNDYYASNSATLKQCTKNFLKNLERRLTINDNILISHANPRYISRWDYVSETSDAEDIFRDLSFFVCFVGHTHIPKLFLKELHKPCVSFQGIPDTTINIPQHARALANPGSIGSSRTSRHYPQSVAHYAFFDSDRRVWQFKAAQYDRS